ncbi:peptide-methionine (S)-S-oxide reductase MsrA [Amedibacillus dolichus]|uniref:peptide-methionine (S)-S-oxide reductase MsrA n=1 Tax=Amedibacillus dolichus TaxID=31971 RepID=UPI001D0142C8|nr:peptide-methionine (S)-S-oxide reductase MsrA [Amedibacillus dolichus]MCB5373779.1 peptide-methionine (S)-S-oxide reductase MsrA [Amedibacillus dolichus]
MRRHDIYFAGGCFWGVEKYFSLISGVVSTRVGYANGSGTAPTYEEVCENTRGFVECVHVIFDPEQVTLRHLLNMFFAIIDPTSINKQGNDEGLQYRSGIYYTTNIDCFIIHETLNELQKQYEAAIAVEALPLQSFYLAEEYHQKYLDKNPNGYCHIPQFHFEQAKNRCALKKKQKEE